MMIDVKTEKEQLHKRFTEEMEARSWEEIWRIMDKAQMIYPIRSEEVKRPGFKYRRGGRRFGWG